MLPHTHEKRNNFDPPGAKFEDMRQFLAINPLPPELRHLDPHLRKLSLRAFLDLVTNSAIMGLNDDQIADGIRRMAEFSDHERHRCATCLRWVTEYHAICAAGDGAFDIFALCTRCAERIDRGQGTTQMRRNFLAYGMGLERRP